MIENYQKHRDIFNNIGYCTLDVQSIFGDDLLIIHEDMCNANDENWTYIVKYRDFEEDLATSTKSSIIAKHKLEATRQHSTGEFAFFFKRMTTDHRLPIPVTKGFNLALNLVNSSKMKDLIELISSRKIGQTSHFYVNKFEDGSFLGIHRDGGNNIGIALNISKNWLPTNGGITHILDESMNIVDSLSPSFGRLLIFDSKKANVPHFVSTVTSNNGGNRMSIIARYN